MIIRLPSKAHRAALVAVSFSVFLIFSYLSVRNALAVYYSGLHTAESLDRAAHLEPADPQNWYLLGRYRQLDLKDPDVGLAIRDFLTGLSLNPVSWQTWLDLAAAYESESNLSAARDAYLHAKKAYPVSPEVSWQYGNFLLRQRELKPAFAEMRRAVEADPKYGSEAFSLSLRVEHNLGEILDHVIPPISEVYVAVIADQIADGQTDIALQVWDRLVALRPRLSLRNVYPLIGALRKSGRSTDARRVWEQAVGFGGLAAIEDPPGSVLWDGGFESRVTGGGYSWLFPEGARNVQISFDPEERHSGNYSLRLIFDGKSIVTSTDICHYIPVLPSTAYTFSAWFKTRAVTTDQGLRFQLRSVGTLDSSVAVTPELHGTEPWTRVEILWSSGRDVREVQACLVRFLSDQLENKIKGTTWIDDVALVPAAAEHSKP